LMSFKANIQQYMDFGPARAFMAIVWSNEVF
jgi:hypothetical protein